MSTIDQLLAKASRLAGARVLFVARTKALWAKGCGVELGRPTHHENVLLVHSDEDELVLPTLEAAPPELALDQPAEFAGAALVLRCDSQFRPPNSKFKNSLATWWDPPFVISQINNCWTDPEFALSSPMLDPTARAAISQFKADSGDHQHTKGLKMDSHHDFIKAQAKCDEVCQAHGMGRAPRHLDGEDLQQYRQRLAGMHQHHSKAYKDADLSKIGCPHTMGVMEDEIYSSAMAALKDGSMAGPGQLQAIPQADASGRLITRYAASDPGACWDQFAPPVQYVRWFNVPGRVQ